MSKFIISLDFELHWGVFDTLGDSYNENIYGARGAIVKMLELFKKYDIYVTWAIVGFLFNENKGDYDKYKPSLLPSYNDKQLSSYNCSIGLNESSDKLHYAHSIIELIKSYPNQEIASHSYSHYYSKEEGQTIEEFEEDIKSAILVAQDKFSISLKSFVFPKNEVNIKYLPILKKYGFTSYRGNPSHWIYKNGQQTNIFGRIIRLVDSYINITGHSSSYIQEVNGLKNIVGDRYLRHYNNLKIFNLLMLKRIKSEMKYAFMHGKNYHLWWHPHNFGININENLDNLEIILKYYSKLKVKYNINSVCMQC